MKNGNNRRRTTALKATIKQYESELNIGAKILEWEIGDIWGHVGVRLPDGKSIAVRMFRRAEQGKKDWLVHFDFTLQKLSGVGTIPRESVIYTEIFKARIRRSIGCTCNRRASTAAHRSFRARSTF
jgi:hypothetical protein